MFSDASLRPVGGWAIVHMGLYYILAHFNCQKLLTFHSYLKLKSITLQTILFVCQNRTYVLQYLLFNHPYPSTRNPHLKTNLLISDPTHLLVTATQRRRPHPFKQAII